MRKPIHRLPITLGIAGIILLFTSLLQAQDKVILQLEGSSSPVPQSGKILDYTGEKLVLRAGEKGPVREFSASEVVEIHTPHTQSHQKALKLFSRNRIEEAESTFQNALNEEVRNWVRRDIMAMLVRCAVHRGDYSAAAHRFWSLLKSDSKTRHFKLIPLVWASENVPSSLKNEAVTWLSENSDAMQLIGASILLGDGKYGSVAESQLRELSSNPDRRIRGLARAQLWRIRLNNGKVGSLELQRWEDQVKRLPSQFRGGPYYLLGRGLLQRHENERAAMALLWVPLVYDHNPRLAARACFEAAEALRQMGQLNSALVLYHEVNTRFSETSYAQEAADRLEQFAGNGNKNNPQGSSGARNRSTP